MSDYSDLELQEQLMSQLEEMQNEINQYKQTIQKLLSEKHELVSTVAEQEKRIAEQTDIIETQNESDIQLLVADTNLKIAEEKLKQVEKEKENIAARISEAAASEERAKTAWEKVERKEAAVERHIQIRVMQAEAGIERRCEQKLQADTKKMHILTSSILPAMALYSLFLTIIWGSEQIDVIKTFPEWFVCRWKNIKDAAELARTGFFKIHDFLPERWYSGVRYAIPVIIYLCIAVGLFLAPRAAIRRFKAWYCSIWSKYQDKAEKRLKMAYTASLGAISFLTAVLLDGKTPLHWFSWFLICSIVSHLIHHAAGRQHSERR